ncbi:MAG TPA: hypothetical protein VFR24_24635 [Candidatus Angelobacter sp.]|nr:hypothetical protein [Candidatus Angelobacter sp.]
MLFSGCGGNPGNSAQTTNLRVVNGCGGITSINVLVNGTGQNRTYYLFQNDAVISTQPFESCCGLDFKAGARCRSQLLRT